MHFAKAKLPSQPSLGMFDFPIRSILRTQAYGLTKARWAPRIIRARTATEIRRRKMRGIGLQQVQVVWSQARLNREKLVESGKSRFLHRERMRPTLAWIAETNRLEAIEVPHKLDGVVGGWTDIAGFVLNRRHPLRDTDIFKGIEEKVLPKVDRVDNILQAEKVGFTPDDLLLAHPEPPVTRRGVHIELAERIDIAVGVGVVHRDIERIVVEVLATPAIERHLAGHRKQREA